MYSIYKQLFNEKKKLSVTQRFVFVVIIFSFFLIIIESEKSIKSINPYIFEYLNIFLSYFFDRVLVEADVLWLHKKIQRISWKN